MVPKGAGTGVREGGIRSRQKAKQQDKKTKGRVSKFEQRAKREEQRKERGIQERARSKRTGQIKRKQEKKKGKERRALSAFLFWRSFLAEAFGELVAFATDSFECRSSGSS